MAKTVDLPGIGTAVVLALTVAIASHQAGPPVLLVLAAAYVYRIKFDATVQAERLAKLRGEGRHERDQIAALRAEWGRLDDPARVEALAKRLDKDEAAKLQNLPQITKYITGVITQHINPRGQWGLIPYISFRSQSEQAALKEEVFG